MSLTDIGGLFLLFVLVLWPLGTYVVDAVRAAKRRLTRE